MGNIFEYNQNYSLADNIFTNIQLFVSSRINLYKVTLKFAEQMCKPNMKVNEKMRKAFKEYSINVNNQYFNISNLYKSLCRRIQNSVEENDADLLATDSGINDDLADIAQHQQTCLNMFDEFLSKTLQLTYFPDDCKIYS